jgi:hypothetical protein
MCRPGRGDTDRLDGGVSFGGELKTRPSSKVVRSQSDLSARYLKRSDPPKVEMSPVLRSCSGGLLRSFCCAGSASARSGLLAPVRGV